VLSYVERDARELLERLADRGDGAVIPYNLSWVWVFRLTGSCLLEPLCTSRTDVVDLIALGFTATEGDLLMSVYKVIEIIGSSSQSWEDAATEAIETARQTVRDLRVAEVVEQDLDLADGNTITFRTKLRVSFKYEGE
jgi:flavin-binding protein dodecin